MLDEAKALLIQLGYDVATLEASTNRAVGVLDQGTGKMVGRAQAAARQINAELGKVNADGLRASLAQVAAMQDLLTDATVSGSKAVASALRAEIDVRERVQRATAAQLQTQLAVAKATGQTSKATGIQDALGLFQQVQRQNAVGITGKSGLQSAESVVAALAGGGGKAGLSQQQLMELGHSARAMADGLAAGMNPMRLMAMEAPRLAQALGEGQGGVGGAMKALSFLLNPTVILLAALAAALAAGVISAIQYVNGVNQVMSAVAGLGRVSGATVSDIESLARAQTQSGKISESAAQALAVAMITTGKVTRENLMGSTAVVEEFAEVTRTKLADATKIMAKAFEDPAKGAKELVETYGLLSGAEVEEIERLQQRGDKTGALTKLIDGLKTSLDQASGGLKAHAEGWDAIANAAKNAWTEMGKAVATSAGAGSTGARLEALQNRRKTLDNPLQNAALPEIDRQIAELKAQQAKENAQAAANAKDAQFNQKSLSVAEAAKALDKTDTKIQTIQTRQKDLRDALADPTLLAKSGLTRPQAQHALAEGDKQIADIRKRGQHDGADQTATFDKSAQEAYDSNLHALAEAQAALITGIHDHASAEKSAVDEQLQKTIHDLDAKEAEIKKSKNDAHKQEQLTALGAAKIEAQLAAQLKKELIDRQAAAAALAEVIKTRDFVQAQQTRISGNDAAEAPTAAERNAINRANLLAEQKLARNDFDAETEQERQGRSGDDLDSYLRNRGSERSALVAGQQSDLGRQSFDQAGPLDKYLRSMQDLNTNMQQVGVEAIQSFDTAILNVAQDTHDAGRILENWLIGIALKAASQELAAEAAPALVAGAKGVLSFFGLAGGGHVRGPGTPTSDSIPAMLSDGEYVVKASATRQHLALLNAINSGKPLKLAGGGLVGLPSFPLIGQINAMTPPRAAGVQVHAPIYNDLRGSIVAEKLYDRINQASAQAAEAGAQRGRALAVSDVSRAQYHQNINQ